MDWHREGVGWEVGGWEVDWGEHGWSGGGEGVAANGHGKTGALALGGLGGDTGDSAGGLAGVVGVPGLGVPGLMGTSTASEPVGAGSWLGDAGLAVNRVGTESGLRSGLLAASVTLSMAATCGFQNCGGAGYEACLGCYLWSF